MSLLLARSGFKNGVGCALPHELPDCGLPAPGGTYNGQPVSAKQFEDMIFTLTLLNFAIEVAFRKVVVHLAVGRGNNHCRQQQAAGGEDELPAAVVTTPPDQPPLNRPHSSDVESMVSDWQPTPPVPHVAAAARREAPHQQPSRRVSNMLAASALYSRSVKVSS